MRETLGLKDGEDGLDLEEVVQTAFAFDWNPVSSVETMGDLHDAIWTQVSARAKRGDACLTLMAFNRLRAALMSIGHDRTALTRATPLVSLEKARPRRLIARLAAHSQLDMPLWRLTGVGAIGSALLLASIAWVLVALFSPSGLAHAAPIIAPLALLAFAIALLVIDPGAYKRSDMTLGDLAFETAHFNYARLLAEGARQREGDLWQALVFVVEDAWGKNGEITRETRFW
jgi:hypothetical protein